MIGFPQLRQWIGSRDYWKPSIFPLNMELSCKTSLKPMCDTMHWLCQRTRGYHLVMTNIAMKRSTILRTVNHLFLWAIYTMAICQRTRGYMSINSLLAIKKPPLITIKVPRIFAPPAVVGRHRSSAPTRTARIRGPRTSSSPSLGDVCAWSPWPGTGRGWWRKCGKMWGKCEENAGKCGNIWKITW